LVGGFGTRLRPLTFELPKPLIPFCNMPIVEHQIAAAVEAGVTHVILAVGFRPESMQEAMETMMAKYKIKITMSIEDKPLGTAGPIRLAEKMLREGGEEPFYVFNADTTSEYHLKELYQYHLKRGGEATIAVTPVDDPSKFGVVLHDEGAIRAFVEKPQTFVGNQINAGCYVMNCSVIDRVEDRPMMFERDIFPQLAEEKKLFAFDLEGYWADIGQPKDYLRGMVAHLDANKAKPDWAARGIAEEGEAAMVNTGYTVKGPCMIHPTAQVGAGCVIGPHVTIDENCVIGAGVRLKTCAIMARTTVKDHAYIQGAIIGWDNTVGKWARIEELTVTGVDVQIADEVIMNGVFLLPHKGFKESVMEKGKICM